ncbi:MAG: LysM peptidoglycan-binding domain-containing protein [Moraxellaceae bacterium]|nr:LysM peptidoglycan-binding domain-containing protein [Moraxellaceae bacterium]
MQYWLYLRKNAQQLALFATVSLLLSACTNLPQNNTSNTPISANNNSALNSNKKTENSKNLAKYYDTTGLVVTQDDIDEMLGVTEMDAATLSPEELASFGDVWARTRAGFKLDIADNERVAQQIAWFAKRQDYLDRMTARASHYLYHTVTEAEKAGVPTELALLPIIESSYDPFATSPAQAAGLWQFIPSTGKIFGLRQTWWYDGRRDILESTRAAYKFLSQLYNQFGSWELALAAYNWGPGNVKRAIERNEAAGLPTDYWSLTMPAETMAYVPRFLAVAQVIKEPNTFGVRLNPIVNKAHFRETYAKNQVDLTSVAKLAGLTTKQLYQLNPAYMRWATNPDGPHRVLVPLNTPEIFEQQLAALPAPDRYITVTNRYVVKKGDSLHRIASKFGTTPAALKRLNGKLISKRGYVAVGKSLVVSRSKQLVSGDNSVDIEKLANPAAERVAQIEKADKEKAVAAKSTRKDDDDDKVSKKYHKVRAGQSLYAIAKKYDVSVKELAQWNNLKNKSNVQVGTKLVILLEEDEDTKNTSRTAKASKGKDKRIASKEDSPKKNKKERIKRISYEVKRGDTLYSISQRYNVSVSQIKTWNKTSKNLKPGQDLIIYLAKS